jgi:hypothetical protein
MAAWLVCEYCSGVTNFMAVLHSIMHNNYKCTADFENAGYYFFRANYFTGHFKEYFEGPRLF